jgi:large subunit ribosomal protein L23
MSAEALIIGPLITEKGTIASEKDKIRLVVEDMFKVTVLTVRTANFLGKERRRGRVVGRKADWKKAYVTLKEGDKIEFFEGV